MIFHSLVRIGNRIAAPLVYEEKGSAFFSINFIGASKQKAGMLAKALPPAHFEPSRKLSLGKLSMGW